MEIKKCLYCGKEIIGKNHKLTSIINKKYCNENCRNNYYKYSVKNFNSLVEINESNFHIRKLMIKQFPIAQRFKGLSNIEINFFIELSKYKTPNETLIGRLINGIVPDAIFIYEKEMKIIAIEYDEKINQNTLNKYLRFPMIVDELWLFANNEYKNIDKIQHIKVKQFKSFEEFKEYWK